MNDAVAVGVVQREGHVAEDGHDGRRSDDGLRGEPVGQRCSIDVRHNDEHHAVHLVGAMNRYDVRVRELRRCSRLAKESLSHFGHVGEQLGQDFDRDCSVELDVRPEVHDPHSTTTDLAIEHEVRREGARAGLEF